MMIKQLSPLTFGAGNRTQFETSSGLGTLIEKIWQDVGCQVSRDQVKRLVLEESKQFQGFGATKFASNLVHRRVRIRLIEETV